MLQRKVAEDNPLGSGLGLHEGLALLGLYNSAGIKANLHPPQLYREALVNGEAELASAGALVARTGIYTGRSPKDRFIVEEPSNRDKVDWGSVNLPFDAARFDALAGRLFAYLQGRSLYVQDLFIGANELYRLPIRIITEQAWHSLFARNMFLRPRADDLGKFEPQFTVVQAPGFRCDPARDGTRTEAAIIINFSARLIIIAGTAYAGEIKKSVFSVMNFLLPENEVLPMHCSANRGERGDTVVFFGLSGTGKTTLSADARRVLIGDDEHGWSEEGVFNFEGGCYAKTIKLSEEGEPEIYEATQRFGTILENVCLDPVTAIPDFDDASLTENTRACYPIDFIPNAARSGKAGAPHHIVMLTADAFGVLPPLARLTPEQAVYHFLSGFTSKLAGTERGVTEPQVTFSTCFGSPFMVRHPSVYAGLLEQKIREQNVKCWLVNTGWTGGGYSSGGQRMALAHTRAMINAILEDDLEKVEFRPESFFNLSLPKFVPDVPSRVLHPRDTWKSGAAYDQAARALVDRFRENFCKYESFVDESVLEAKL